MALPRNSKYAKDNGCAPVSSNCVVWQGPDIPCINLCNGDTVSDVVYKLATELCSLLEQFDISVYDISCLNLQPSETPVDIKELIQTLINKTCDNSNSTQTNTNTTSPSCPDSCIMDLAPCFTYNNELGDPVVTMSLTDYVTAIGNRICNIIDTVNNLQSQIDSLNQQINGTGGIAQPNPTGIAGRLGQVESTYTPLSRLNYQVNPNIDPSGDTVFITDALRTVETNLVNLTYATGTANSLFASITLQGNFSNKKLLSGSGAYSSLTNWRTSPENAADSIGNLWLALNDIYNAVNYMQENCCNTGCSSINLNFRASLTTTPNPNLVIYVDGSTGFTPEWTECNSSTLIEIKDELGNSSTYNVPIMSILTNPNGYLLDISSTTIDVNTNLTVTAKTCFKNTQTNSECSKDYTYIIYKNVSCPTVTLTPSQTTVTFAYSKPAGYTNIINIYIPGGTTPVASQTISADTSSNVNSVIYGLYENTPYEFELTLVDTGGNSTPCPRVPFTTLGNICYPPTLIDSVTITV